MEKQMTSKIKGALALAMGAFLAVPAAAQLHENVEVEGRYVPEIIRADRINAFPSPFSPLFKGAEMNYEESGVPASFMPAALPMPATGWRSVREIDGRRGYLDIAAGSWLNSSLSAGYRIIDEGATTAGIRLQHNSTSLWKPDIFEGSDVKRWRYDESVGLYASHVFSGIGRLDASLDYHLGLFNYYGYDPTLFIGGARPVEAPTQTLNDIDFNIGWRSPLTATPALSYHAGLGVRHFGYRALPFFTGWSQTTAKGLRETQLSLHAGVSAPWGDGSSAGLELAADALLYAQGEEMKLGSVTLPAIDDYGMVTITPYYSFTRGLLQVKAGVDLDLAVKAGPEGSRYSFLHVAPDVRFAVRTGAVGLSLDLLGGSELQTLSSLWQLDYYQMPRLATTRPVYSPLDARFAVNLGPFRGFDASLFVAWKKSDRVPLRGWYMPMVSQGVEPVDGLQGDGVPSYSLDAAGMSLHGFSLGGELRYAPGSYVDFRGALSYQPQNGKKGYFNGYDRPRWLAEVALSVMPVEPLTLTVDYRYRGVRTIYCNYYDPSPELGGVSINGSSLRPVAVGMRLPDLTLLGAGATWRFTPDFSVSLRGDNLLGRHDAILPGLPSEGVCVTAGFQWLF